MKLIYTACLLAGLSYLLIPWGYAQEPSIRIEFSGATAEENGLSISGAGFGALPAAEVTFGAIPIDASFEHATDGIGAIIEADPGEGVMISPTVLQSGKAALIRFTVRSNGPHASVYLASVDLGENQFISTLTPNQGAFFTNQYRRMTTLFIPPSQSFLPIIQVTNTHETEPLIVYLDNWEIFLLEPGYLYHEEFLNGDEIDPDVLGIPEDRILPGTPTPFPTMTPTAIPSPPQTPTPSPTPSIDIIEASAAITIDLPNLPSGSTPLEMILIPAGTFWMGSPPTDPDAQVDELFHSVTLSHSFYLGKYEITQAQWTSIQGSNPSINQGNPNFPIDNVSWDDCQMWIQSLNGLTGKTFRLPTEAEWEYACRAQTQTRFHWGEDTDYSQIISSAWFSDNSGYQPHSVGGWPANSWNLFDMNGNVWEWCQDGYDLYPEQPTVDPIGPIDSHSRVIRGGSWADTPENCRSAYRSDLNKTERYHALGFRLFLSIQ